jgi:hypothetical protein
MTRAATEITRVTSGLEKLTSTLEKTQKQFGIDIGSAAKLQIEALIGSVDSYIKSAMSGLTTLGVTPEQISGARDAYQNEFGGILTTDAAEDLAIQARTMGVTAEQLTKARRVFTAQSLGNVVEAKKSQDKFIAEFAKKGLTSKEAMQAISQYSELLARNGTRFAQAFTRAAADAKKIGIDLAKVSQFGDSLINDFEGFLEGTANLGAMGFNLDSNRLAQISETGSDADLFNELRSQLASTGKDITKLRRSERLELESMFGMPISDMQKLAGETPAGNTKSAEELQSEANGALAKIAVGIDLLSTIMKGGLAAITLATSITAAATSFLAGGFAPVILPLLGIAAAIAVAVVAIVGIASFFGGKKIKMPSLPKLKGDDVVSQPGYGKRSLVTPSGVIALNNKDNIIAYADDLDGTKKLPYGSIAKKASEKYEQLDNFKRQVNDVFAQLISPSGGFGQISKFLNKDLGPATTNKVMSGKVGGTIAKAQELKAGGTGGLLSTAQTKFGGMFGGKAGGAMSSISNLFTGGGSTSSNLMGLASKIPGVGGLLGKATGLLGGGGLKGLAGGLLGKVGLGSLGGSLLGGPMGLAASLAAPLLKKIPLVGNTLAAIAGGPGKLMSSVVGKVGGFLGSKKGKGVISSIAGGPMGLAAPLLKKIPLVGGALSSIAGGPGKLIGGALGKIGGLFGKKKAPAVSAMGATMPEMGNMMSMLPFLSGAQSMAPQATTQPQAPISVDTTGIEKQLNNFINALSNIQVNMDGSKVGKLLVSSNEAAASLGVLNAQSR